MTRPGATGQALLDAAALAGVVDRLGREITRDYPDGVVLVGLLKSCACFLADLARAVRGPCELDFLGLSSYGDGRTRVRVAKDLDIDVADRDVVVVVDLVDTGLTLGYVGRLLAARQARSVAACALLDRRNRRVLPVEVRYVGETVGDEYLVGYGLDLGERFRNLPGIHVADRDELRNGSGGDAFFA